jgi:predicted  nucleic acid-binding Zn ribbon protein
MILANVIFGAPSRKPQVELEALAENYLGALFQAGQLCGEYFITRYKDRLSAHVLLAGRGATALRHHSQYGKEELEKVIKTFGARPVWQILDDDAHRRPSSWTGAPFLYLFTHALDWAPPVCRGDGKPPIPTFMLPLNFEQKTDLYRWQWSYYYHDNIWLGCGALEIAAYKQMADPTSELAAEGRDLCRDIERCTGVPTFYYLTRYWGKPKGEAERPCPGCGSTWKVEWPTLPKRRFWHFDFKCDRCRLVSHLGNSTDGGRHTRIGEFNPSKSGKRVLAATPGPRH